MKQKSYTQSFLHFCIGGFSGAFATSLIQPIDTLKVQIQIVSQQMGKSLVKKSKFFIFDVFKHIYQQKGILIFYRGLGSAIWRQLFYSSVRLGLYTFLTDKLKNNGYKIGFIKKIALSAFCGILGAIVGTPFDVALVRRQASITTGENAYKSTIAAFTSILKEEGFFKIWRGVNITMLRVAVINVSQLAGNQIITQTLSPYFSKNKQFLKNTSAILASVLASILSLPIDNIKVKLQKQSQKNMKYSNIFDCFIKTIQREGFFRLWVGFPVYFFRGLPHSIVLIRTQQFLISKIINPQ